MTEFSLSPFEMRMLLHYCGSRDPFKSQASQDLTDEARVKLLTADLMAVNAKESCIEVTDRGRAWIERALATPLPVQRWVWE